MLSKLPQSKTENIVVQTLENETLIYNLESNKVFCLNETSALVYQACNGKTALQELKNKHQFTDEVIFLALDLLKKENLLEENFSSPLEGMKRREVIKKIGIATSIVLPLISIVTAPTSLMAASTCGGTNTMGFIICTMGIPGCEVNIAATCQSCSATAILPPFPGCADPFPFGCICN